MWLKFLMDALADESKHFAAAFFSGLLAYLLTWIMFSVLCRITRRLIPGASSTVAGFITTFLPLLAGLACALLSHSWLDGFSIWYTTPLAPALQLIK